MSETLNLKTMTTRLTCQYLNQKLLTLILAFAIFFVYHPLAAVSAPAQKESKNLDLKMFEGSYQLLGNQNAYIKITAYGDQLTLKELWSNREISFTQKTDLSFIAADLPEFTLDFTRDKSGAITQVVAFKRDVWVKVKPNNAPAKLSPADTEKLSKTYQTIFTAFQEAINSNSDEKIKSFLKTYMDESVLAALTSENLTARAKELYQNMGAIERDTQQPVDLATGTATFKGKNQNNLFQMSFTLNPQGKIMNFGLKE